MLSARIILALASALILAGLWFAFRPNALAPEAATQAAAPTALAARLKEFQLVVRDSKLASGPATLQVRQGDEVRLRIESDRSDELHLHGYDLKLRIKGGETATLEFAAALSGRFELELHRKHAPLGALEVYPK
jgi:plastocyanin